MPVDESSSTHSGRHSVQDPSALLPLVPAGRGLLHPFSSILPPHILRSIAERGSPGQRTRALQALAADFTFRSIRYGGQLGAGMAAKSPAGLGEPGEKHRTICDARHAQELPGKVVRTEGSAKHRDPAVNEAYDGLGATYDLFWEVWGRDSIDDEGMPLDATVHFGRNYDNAFWDGSRMVFGDGDGELFNRFTVAVDVIGHELAHGVTQDEAKLKYLGQSGALNESLSDVFGVLVKQRSLKQTADQADWLIGEGLFTASVSGDALRSMKSPGTAFDDPVLGKDPQPAHMKDYVRTFEDNGGVHINSGIPNRAFYLTASALGGSAWETAGRIWYESLRDNRLRPGSGFRHFATITTSQAARLFGRGSPEQRAVRDGWVEVGVETEKS